jgi:hypothetical protein
MHRQLSRPWQLVPRPLSDLSHVLVLLYGAVYPIAILGCISAPEPHDGETAYDQSSCSEDNEEYDQGWSNRKVVSLLEDHDGEVVIS